LKILFNYILIVLFFNSCSEKLNIDFVDTIMFEGKLYELNSDVPISGKVFNMYSNGFKEYEGEYIDGKPHGNLIYWYDTGVKMREGKLNNGVPIGIWSYYNKFGVLEKTMEY
tara:strand:- start:142 stop:477 length:336 start_codon:yes stop_codon:yes gene_type:complete